MIARVISIIILLLALIYVVSGFRGRARFKQRKCEKVTIPLCKEVGYNLTYMPNQFGHNTQFDAGLIIHQFWPLVLINCSSLLKHFVCSLYAPMCDPIYHKEILPCRSFCTDVRDKCEPVMKQHGFKWPEHLKCARFPTRKINSICMKPEPGDVPDSSSNKPKDKIITPNNNGNTPKKTIRPATPVKKVKVVEVVRTPNNYKFPGGCGCSCEAPFAFPNESQRQSGELPLCVLPCKRYFFKDDEMKFMNFWLGLWSIITIIATIIACATFLLDRSRYEYTERPIILIACCYAFVSFGYIIRLIYGHESIACNSKTNLIRYSATGPAHCTAVFILTYFFSNVAWIWWVVLSMIWFLTTGLNWSTRTIANYSQYFHFIAWLIPTVQTMAILAMAAIDGDPVSGLCSVGNHDNNTLTIFVIAPLLIYAMLSTSFFVAGILAYVHRKRAIRNILRHIQVEQNESNEKLSGHVSKIGIYTFALLIPALSLIACYFYEHNSRALWESSRNCTCMKEKTKPNFYAFLYKYFTSLMIGLVTAFWVLETRTIEIWKKFFQRVCSKRQCTHENGSLMGHKFNGPVAQL